MSAEPRRAQYRLVCRALAALVKGELDEIAVMATIACELHHAFDSFDWVGFYRVTEPRLLKIGPYQGGHGCLTIPFSKGVCGKCARENKVQVVPDVTALPYHIACASTTRSEIVVPVRDPAGVVRAVLDIDSDTPSNFSRADVRPLERICAFVTRLYPQCPRSK